MIKKSSIYTAVKIIGKNLNEYFIWALKSEGYERRKGIWKE
ncbi:MAG: hypothetical protein Q4D53_01170 [Leptotrichiaceae bacterium]|nr:hypothetical protein [Leptotrichiaceae bacterium]